MKAFLFCYCLVAGRVLYLQAYILYHLYRMPTKHMPQRFIRAVMAVLFWPVDFAMVPGPFFKAYVLADRTAAFELGFYYGRTVFGGKSE